MRERWRAAEGFEGYEVSNLGQVRSWRNGSRYGSRERKTPRVIVGGKDGQGRIHMKVTCGGGRARSLRPHVAIARAFIGPRPSSKHDVHHIDGDPLNNAAANLQYLTRKEHVKLDGRVARRITPRGECNHAAKLTERKVREIRQQHGLCDSRTLAEEYGVHKNSILNIWSGQTWGHIEAGELEKV